MTRVLDAHALMVFLEKEPGFEKISRHFAAAAASDDDLLMTAVNFGEVYYIVLRECGPKKAEEIESLIQTLPIEIIAVDWDLTREAARFKASYPLSYADCFAAALAKTYRAELVTGDREFIALENLIRIDWL